MTMERGLTGACSGRHQDDGIGKARHRRWISRSTLAQPMPPPPPANARAGVQDQTLSRLQKRGQEQGGED